MGGGFLVVMPELTQEMSHKGGKDRAEKNVSSLNAGEIITMPLLLFS